MNTVSDFARNIAEMYPSPAVRAFADKLIAYDAIGGVEMSTSNEVFGQWRKDLNGLYIAMSKAERAGCDKIENEMGVSW